ncbi:MAG TPA: hypothetical protein DDZ51_25060 [Planctomycetaceae bacterium]|nr:hypothetical protein [Planctomycetaceae bacterium]
MQTRRGRFGPTLLIWTLLTLPLWVGCDGCRLPGQASNPPPPPPPEVSSEFNFGGIQALPLGNTPGQMGVKPGHWFTASETIRANRADHRGLLRQRIELQPQANVVDSFDLSTPADSVAGEKILVPLLSERPAVLPQMRTKRFDARLLAGLPRSVNRNTQALLSGQFVSSTPATLPDFVQRSVSMLQPQEYFFIVLTKRPERFSSLQTADWIRPPVDQDESELASETPTNYRLVLPKTEGLLTLPETMFDWTSTAVLLWDDLDPSTLTVQQTRAMIDWVHFGGRLIINGTGAGIELTRSNLGPLMPMEIQGNGELDAASVADLLESWSVTGDTTTQQQVAIARERSARLQVDGQVHPDAVSVRDTSDLMLRRQVGSGQVILSRFDLTSDWMLGWRSRDSFFNAAVLGRPPRKYVTIDDVVRQRFADDKASRIADASTNTGLRLMARDGRLVKASAVADSVNQPSALGRGEAIQSAASEPPEVDPAKKPGSFQGAEFVAHPIAGMGSWRDDSDVAILARATLRSQSGIVIPPRPFVIKALAIYLAVLVPLNYLFFRVLGRLEWAWLAVPVIGLGGAAWIARGASLDVGFARSRTEIAILEMQPEYSRAHATRFISLYNSLSRRYDFAFDSPDAAVAPFGILGQVKPGDEEREPVTLRYGFADGPILSGVSVASNRTLIFHAEQILDMGGSVQLRNDSLRNNTQFELLDCWVIGREKDGSLKVANLGTCAAGARVRVRWSQSGTVSLPNDLPLDLQQLMSPMLRGETLPPGATRLVARCEMPLPGMTISPEPAQQTSGAVVIVHLTRPAIDVPSGDANLMPDRLEKQRQNRLDDDAPGDADVDVKVNASF